MKRQTFQIYIYIFIYLKMTNLLHVKINQNFMKSSYIIQNKQKLVRTVAFKKMYLQVILMPGLIGENRILLSASALDFLQYVALVEAYEEKSTLTRHVFRKRGDFCSHFRYFWIFFFDITLKFDSGSFLWMS